MNPSKKPEQPWDSENDRFKGMARSLSGRKKWEHIWEYYKLPIIAALAALVLAASLLNQYVFNPAPEVVLDVSIMAPNVDYSARDALVSELNARLLDPGRNETVQVDFLGSTVSTDANVVMGLQTKMMAKASLNELDVAIIDGVYYELLAEENALADLDALLSPRARQALGDRYLGNAVLADDMAGIQTLLGYVPAEEDLGSVYLAIFENSARKEMAAAALLLLAEQ